MSIKIAILGNGAMATACSILLSENPEQRIAMWCRSSDYAQEMNRDRENRRLLPGVPLPEALEVTADIDQAVAEAEFLIASIPTKFLRSALTVLAPHLKEDRPVVSVIKGLENQTFMRPSEIIEDVLGSRPVVALGGPSHAEEISRRLPASVVAASGDITLAKTVQEMFTTDRFRVYTNTDMIGVELAGALKNVIAIAAGICDGLKYGDNAKSALVTRGLVEISRFGEALGAEPLTFSGLAGMGDLLTTCTSPYSRNRAVGERLGQGETLNEILNSMHGVAEGVTTTSSVYELAEQKGIDMPITKEVYRVLFEEKNPEEATDTLMGRPPKDE